MFANVRERHFYDMEVLTIPMVTFSLAISLILIAGKRRLVSHGKSTRWDNLISFGVSLLITVGAVANYFYSDSVKVILDQRSLVLIAVATALMIDRFYSSTPEAEASSSCGMCNPGSSRDAAKIVKDYVRHSAPTTAGASEVKLAPKIKTFVSRFSPPAVPHALEEDAQEEKEEGQLEPATHLPSLLYTDLSGRETGDKSDQHKGTADLNPCPPVVGAASEEHQSCDSEPSYFQATMNVFKSKIVEEANDCAAGTNVLLDGQASKRPSSPSGSPDKACNCKTGIPKGTMFATGILPRVPEKADVTPVTSRPKFGPGCFRRLTQAGWGTQTCKALIYSLCAVLCAIGGAGVVQDDFGTFSLPTISTALILPLTVLAGMTGYEYKCGAKATGGTHKQRFDSSDPHINVEVNNAYAKNTYEGRPISEYCSTCTGSETYTETVYDNKRGETEQKATSTSPFTDQVKEEVADVGGGNTANDFDQNQEKPVSGGNKQGSKYTLVDSTSIWSSSGLKTPAHFGDQGYSGTSLFGTAVLTAVTTSCCIVAGYLYYLRLQPLPFYKRPTWIAGMMLLLTAGLVRAGYEYKTRVWDKQRKDKTKPGKDGLSGKSEHHGKGCACTSCQGKKDDKAKDDKDKNKTGDARKKEGEGTSACLVT